MKANLLLLEQLGGPLRKKEEDWKADEGNVFGSKYFEVTCLK